MFWLSPPRRLKARPIILSPAMAGPPLLPGLIAASIWMRNPDTGKLYEANSMRETMPLVIDSDEPPVGKPYASTGSLICGSLLARATGGWLSKKLGSSSCSTARSMPGAIARTDADNLSPAAFAWICTWLAYSTACALVKIRLPSITTPEAVASLGACLVHGLKGSGYRMVEKIFTTEFSRAAWG